MRWVRLPFLLGIGCAVLLAGCRHGSRAEKRALHSGATAEPVPTPDTTPVEVLRTPAGLVLKLEEAPAATPTPQAQAVSATETQKTSP